MITPESPPLILFSGLAADARIFVGQKLAFPNLIVPPWPTPTDSDTLDSYCDRLAESLAVHDSPILGGASFGGIIALHVAQRLQPRAVILIGSVRAPDQLSRLARCARPLRPLVRWIPVGFLKSICKPIAAKPIRRFMPHVGGLAVQFRGADPAVFKWSLVRLFDWSKTPEVDCPIFHIHGDRDRVLPVRYTGPSEVVAGGGHVISVTHPRQVNDFIKNVISEVERAAPKHKQERQT